MGFFQNLFGVTPDDSVNKVDAAVAPYNYQQYAILYTDCVAPVGTSATDLKTKIDAIINNYAANAPSVYYGSYYDSTNQTNAGATSENIVQIGSVFEENGVSIQNGDEITVNNAGTYNLQFSAQFEKTSGPDADVE